MEYILPFVVMAGGVVLALLAVFAAYICIDDGFSPELADTRIVLRLWLLFWGFVFAGIIFLNYDGRISDIERAWGTTIVQAVFAWFPISKFASRMQ